MNNRIALASCAELPEWECDDDVLSAALKAAGWKVAVPVWDDGSVDWSEFDVCLIRTTWDYQERLPEFLAWTERVSQVCSLLNPSAIVRWNSHKTYLRDLEQQGVAIAPTEFLPQGERSDVREIVLGRGWKRGFLKPAIGATASDTLRFDADSAGLHAAQMHADQLVDSQTMLLQPYLSSVETEGELSLIFIDGEPSHGVRKVPVNGDYRVQDDFGAQDMPHEFRPEEMELARHILAQVSAASGVGLGANPLLYARVDFLRDEEGRLMLNELEAIEPSLFFRHGPGAGSQLAAALAKRIAH